MKMIYRYATVAAYPFAKLWLKKRVAAGKEDPLRLRERLGHISITRPQGKVVWIHAASVGESMSVLPLIERLHAADPALHVVLTTGTLSSAKLIAGRLPDRAFHQYVPVDVSFIVKRFLKALKPDLAIWVESEFWPNLLHETHARGIPIYLVNARMSQSSMKRWRWFSNAFLGMMKCFTTIYAGSQRDKQHLHELGVSRVEWAGNLKYDSAVLPADPTKTSGILQTIGDRRIWLAASTHPGEEELVIAAHKKVREVYPEILTILVPRHPHRVDAISTLLANAKLTFAKRSKGQVIIPETDVYLADTLGELGIFYRMAGVVFIGGSLVPHGGHNPIEPAQLDCAMVCGPHMFNFKNIVEELKIAKAIEQLPNAEALGDKVIDLLRDQDAQAAMAERAHMSVDEKRGASDLIAKQLLDALGIEPSVEPDDDDTVGAA